MIILMNSLAFYPGYKPISNLCDLIIGLIGLLTITVFSWTLIEILIGSCGLFFSHKETFRKISKKRVKRALIVLSVLIIFFIIITNLLRNHFICPSYIN